MDAYFFVFFSLTHTTPNGKDMTFVFTKPFEFVKFHF